MMHLFVPWLLVLLRLRSLFDGVDSSMSVKGQYGGFSYSSVLYYG